MRVKGICFSGLIVIWLGADVALYGQNIRGAIVGNVTDSSGAAVPGADVSVTNEGTGIAVKTTTDTTGTYAVADLLAGTYQVNVTNQGFKTSQFSGIRLLTGQTVRQDVVLEVGAVVQTVEVAARPQLVQTDSPTVGGTLLTRELTNLPFVTTTTDALMNLDVPRPHLWERQPEHRWEPLHGLKQLHGERNQHQQSRARGRW